VGFDLYVKMLHDAVEGLKALSRGEPPPPSSIKQAITIDVPLSAYIPESYISDMNLRLSVYQRMASAGEGVDARAALDTPGDLERELNDRFGAPPPPVRNLLYVVRLRVLARIADVVSIAREDPEGRDVLVVRSREGVDLRARVPASLRRELERTDGMTVGHNQIRIDLEVAADAWRDALVAALDAVAGAEVAA
jgi:transcription-repair coupling factor (superfamily II helicase)